MPGSVCVAAAPISNGPRLAAVLSEGIDRLPVGLSSHHWKVLRALLACRTGALGGEVYRCEHCHRNHFRPFACGNRHCPDCQGHLARQWLEHQQARLLPVPYFHLVFTLPHVLNPLIGQNLALLGELLFSCASQTLLQFGTQRWGAQLGLTAVLHTWGQTLTDHYHLHVIVTGGGLRADGSWRRVESPHYLFPVRALSAMYRGKFCAGLQRLFRSGQLQFHGQLRGLKVQRNFQALLRQATLKAWTVYAKRPFAGPVTVLKYLSQYTHRVAISSRRLLRLDQQAHCVCFRYRDYADDNKTKMMTLDTGEFVRRFCRHILPPRFTKLRHYGLLANRGRTERLNRARAALSPSVSPPDNAAIPPESLVRLAQPPDAQAQRRRCPYCGTWGLRLIQVLRPPGWHVPGADSS